MTGEVTDLQVSCELGPHGKYTRPPVQFIAEKTVSLYYIFSDVNMWKELISCLVFHLSYFIPVKISKNKYPFCS
jgi:hypothetical protein